MEPESSSPQLEVPDTLTYPIPNLSSPQTHTPLPEDPFRGDRNPLVTEYFATGYGINWRVVSTNQ